MSSEKAKILMLVEGAKTDVHLMEHLLNIYGISENHKIISYNTNIYTLYDSMFKNNDPSSIDILQLLKEHENDFHKKQIFNEHYSDILLIFDLDPQDPQFSEEKIKEMINFFTESSDMGKLYINYPMVESFYHVKNIPDKEYNTYISTMTELKNKAYKSRVNQENRNKSYSKFAVNKEECNIVIVQNVEKAWFIVNKYSMSDDDLLPNSLDILLNQLLKIQQEYSVFVLCTCIFYIIDYNPRFVTNLVN